MARVHYRYNPETCKYEPIVIRGTAFAKKAMIYFIVSYLIGLGGLVYFNAQYPYWDESELKNENAALRTQWSVLNDELEETSEQLALLEQNDDNTFRAILDLNPLGTSVREAGVGGHQKEASHIPYLMITNAYDKTGKILARLDIEKQSFIELNKELFTKEEMWASRPAIQPINNEDLTHLHTTFGLRLHPLLGYVRPHRGLDFTAPEGSPVYATGDGIIEKAGHSESFGNVIYIRHGFHFDSRYAHLTRYIVKDGDRVKRGQTIGYVGRTGLSGNAHLHYEVLYMGQQVNPINFFQRDLNNKEYEKLIELGDRSIISLD